jgi:hypothetical protein
MELFLSILTCILGGTGMVFVSLAFADFMHFDNKSGFRFLGIATILVALTWVAGYFLVNL